jgi:hypothetical protein
MDEDAPREEEAGPPDLIEAVGGPLGMLETGLPPVIFAGVYAIGGTSILTAGIVSVVFALIMGIVRLFRHETPRHAFTGVVGVAFGAFVADTTGKAENFFLPGLLLNLAYGGAFLISILAGWPLVGVLVSKLDTEDADWREHPARVKTYTRATWLWAGLFFARLAVQLPLYLASALVALGVAKTAMGLPLFALGLWLTWRLVKRPLALPAGAS